MLASGIDPIKFQILTAMKETEILKRAKTDVKRKSIYVKFFTSKEINQISKIKKNNINQATNIKGIYKIYFNNIKKIPSIKNSSSRFGAIISFGKNLQEAKLITRKAKNMIIKK